MSKSKNKPVREALEKEFGSKCMYHEGIRTVRPPNTSKRKYKGKSIQDQLTLHHLTPLRNNGPTTKQNGSVVCRFCHDYIESLQEKEREKVNDELRAYKRNFFKIGAIELTTQGIQQAEIIEFEESEEVIVIPAYDFTEKEYTEYLEQRRKKELEKPKWQRGKEDR